MAFQKFGIKNRNINREDRTLNTCAKNIIRTYWKQHNNKYKVISRN